MLSPLPERNVVFIPYTVKTLILVLVTVHMYVVMYLNPSYFSGTLILANICWQEFSVSSF